MPAQGSLHNRLCRYIRADTHVGQHVQPLDIVLRYTLITAEHHPADTISSNHMGLGQSGERHTEQIRRQRRNGGMGEAVHNQAIVDLIGEDDELMLPGDLDDLFQHLLRIQCAGRIVRVDDHDGLGLIGDLGLHIVDIRIPFGFLITDIMHGGASGQVHACCPKRVIRRRYKNLVTVIEQGGHTEIDELADAIAGIDAIDADIRQILQLGILHNRLTRGKQTL